MEKPLAAELTNGQLCDCEDLAGYETPPSFYQFHNCGYVQRRGALTKIAAEAASAAILERKFKSSKERSAAWNGFFSREMERLARDL